MTDVQAGAALGAPKGLRSAPAGVHELYPAFDITPPELVTAVVTDRGLFLPSALRDYRSGGGPAALLSAF